MAFRLSDLQATVSSIFDDIFHLRTSGGLDKKITLPNLIQAIVKYTEINTATTATENAGTVNKIQIFKNIHTSGIVLTLGSSGKTIDMIPNEVSFVIYNGTTWYQLNDLIEGSAANDKQLNFAADASLLWDESENTFKFNKSLDIAGTINTGLGDFEVYDKMTHYYYQYSSTGPHTYSLPGLGVKQSGSCAVMIYTTSGPDTMIVKLPAGGTYNYMYLWGLPTTLSFATVSIPVTGASVAGGTTLQSQSLSSNRPLVMLIFYTRLT